MLLKGMGNGGWGMGNEGWGKGNGESPGGTPIYNAVWHEIFAGVLFCGLAIFCVLRDLIFAIWKD